GPAWLIKAKPAAWSTWSTSPWTYTRRRFIAFHRGVILVLRTAASPLPREAETVWAVCAASIKRRKAAMLIGAALNVAMAARMAMYMMLARLMTPGALSLATPRDALGCEVVSDVPMMFLPCERMDAQAAGRSIRSRPASVPS